VISRHDAYLGLRPRLVWGGPLALDELVTGRGVAACCDPSGIYIVEALTEGSHSTTIITVVQ